MSDYLNELNDAQREAVINTEGPVMVIAGPGSGKTRVLTYRVAHLIEQGVPPWQVLALTFTNKAAREMKERIERVVGQKARQVWAGTFHSIFARILRTEAHHLGYPNSFTIYDTEDTKSVINGIIREMGLDKKTYNVGAIRSRISSAKSNLITWKSYADNPTLMEQDRMARRTQTFKIYEKYVNRLEQAGAMDFDDLLLMMFRLLYEDHNNARQKYRRQFQYVLVDEFQDTNYLQYAIVKLLVSYEESPRNICIVGDDAQSIYAFRGATIQNIFDFQKDFPDVRLFKLEQNYRSTDFIVNAANDVIDYNSKQIKKKIWTQKKGRQKIKIIRALSDTEEGRKIVDQIVEQKNRFHLANRDLAILYRTNAQSRVFEEYLRRHNLPYKIFGGLSFYQRKEVKDLLAYLRLVVNPRDNEALKRVVNYPKRGIGKTTMDKLITFANTRDLSAWEAIDKAPLSARASKLLLDFKRMVLGFGKKAAAMDAYDSAVHVYRTSGIYDALKNDNSIEGMNRIDNINALLDGIKEFVEEDEVVEDESFQTDKSIAGYLQNIALITDLDEADEEEKDYITLMSAHSAKGLEFPSVFVVGLEENLFPSYLSMDSPEGIDEERRLFYVAITRAQEYLTLSYANSRYQFGQMRYNEKSRFLEEIRAEHVEDTAVISGPSGIPVARSGVSGYFRRATRQSPLSAAATGDFQPSPPSQITPGRTVLHLKFGKGKVIDVDGNNESKVATIVFDEIDNPKRRIMLKFAKLQVVDQ